MKLEHELKRMKRDAKAAELDGGADVEAEPTAVADLLSAPKITLEGTASSQASSQLDEKKENREESEAAESPTMSQADREKLEDALSMSILEDAQYRTVWSELGMPGGAYPMPPLVDESLAQSLTSHVFGLDSFYVHEIELTPVGAVFRGAMRKRDVSLVSAMVQQRLRAHADLAARVRLFLVNDPTSSPSEQLSDIDWDDDSIDAAEPVFLALPAKLLPVLPPRPFGLLGGAEQAGQDGGAVGGSVDGSVEGGVHGDRMDGGVDGASVDGGSLDGGVDGGEARLGLGGLLPPLGCVLLAAATSLFFSDGCYDDAAGMGEVATLAATLIGLQAAHEAGHAVAAAKHSLSVRLPLLIPSPPVGCLGGHTRLASYPANRSALFDFAAAGPIVGGVCSLLAALVGLLLTSAAPDSSVALMPTLTYETLHSSLLVSLLSEIVLGVPSPTASATELALHPMAVAGFMGLLTNAIALLPVGRLDGGRIAIAALGRRAAAAVGGLTLLVLGVATLMSDESSFLSFWALLATLLMRQAEVPCVDEVSEMGGARPSLLVPLAAFALLVLLPAPHDAPMEAFDPQLLQSLLS